MKRHLRESLRAVAALAALVLWLTACHGREALLADAVARAVNAGAPVLVGAYQSDCDAQIDAAPAGEGRKALERCRARWAPVWKALEALAKVHDAYREGGKWQALYSAICAVAATLAELPPGAQLPLLSEVCRVD